MINDCIVLIISDMKANISDENIDFINSREGTKYPYGATYEMLYYSRAKNKGYFREKNGEKLWVLPYLKDIVNIDPLSTVIKEYSYVDYIEFEKTLTPSRSKFI